MKPLPPAPEPLETAGLFAPLHAARPIVIGRAAQSLDGFIATSTGASRWIGGAEDRLHTHRLRALCDAVLVGAGTVLADDPLLTTRACPGPCPYRVVLDPQRRLGAHHRVFACDAPTLLLAARPGADRHGAAEVAVLPCDGAGSFTPRAVLDLLAARGLHRVLVEGGGRTLSRFLAAGALDRLHVTIAPLLLGAGTRAFAVDPVAAPEQGRLPGWTAYALGDDVLLDIALRP